MRVTENSAILDAYERTGSVWRAAKELGLCGQSVHERLVKLGANKQQRVFTVAEFDRLKNEYQAHAAAGTLQVLADDMGRTKQFICRKAGEIGLTKRDRPKAYLRTIENIPPETARALFNKYKSSRKSLTAFAKGNGLGVNGLSSLFTYWFEAEYTAFVEEKNATKNWRYAAGRRFEYRVRDHLVALGAFCMRSPGSKSPVDLFAIVRGEPLFVQCKSNAWHSVTEWNELIDLAALHGATPIYATKGTDRAVSLFLMNQRKDGSRRPLTLPQWERGEQ